MATDINARFGVGTLVTCEKKKRVLALHRIKENEWELPGGKIDPGELPLQAALRELHEETGILVPAAKYPIAGLFTKVMKNDAPFIFCVYAIELLDTFPITIEVNKSHDKGDWLSLVDLASGKEKVAPVLLQLLFGDDNDQVLERPYEGRGGNAP